MKRLTLVALLCAVIGVACTHKEQTSTSTESGSSSTTATSAAASTTAATSAPASSGKQYLSFQFNDVAVTTSGNPILRLGVTAKNAGPDPVLCEEGMFTLRLADGTILPPDAGAENRCSPDTIDQGSTSNITIFFDLKGGYSGPVTLMMSQDNAVIGSGTTQVH
ncbi:MAG: hypothetical protein M3Z41_02335 [Candidatus Eremiobacteraeota bacterium]|nr:hypothetical protein [Candidatus Eremiobacteraeota bacterium]